MTDLKILSIRDLLNITGVDYAQGISPLSLVIQGEQFDQATQVLVNDYQAPEFMVVSSTKIIAQVPSSERNNPLRRLAVLADKPSVKRSSVLNFEIGSSIQGMKGLEKLVQIFCKLLLQTPGTDRFNPTDGGGLLSAVGRNMTRNDTRSVQSTVVGAVSRARDQLLTKQARDSRIPADERLLTATTEAVGFDANTTTVTARVALSAVSGRTAVANLSF